MSIDPYAPREELAGLFATARERMRTRHLALRTEQAYLQWLRRYLAFHGERHPREVGAGGVERFLTHLAVRARCAQSARSRGGRRLNPQ